MPCHKRVRTGMSPLSKQKPDPVDICMRLCQQGQRRSNNEIKRIRVRGMQRVNVCGL